MTVHLSDLNRIEALIRAQEKARRAEFNHTCGFQLAQVENFSDRSIDSLHQATLEVLAAHAEFDAL